MYSTYKETERTEQRQSRVQSGVKKKHLEIESALVFIDLKSITISGGFWNYTVHLHLLKTNKA